MKKLLPFEEIWWNLIDDTHVRNEIIRNFKDDKLHGIQKYYDEKGNLRQVTEYKNGVHDGFIKEYYLQLYF